MAKQKSIIKLKGSLDDITFYKSKDGYIAREKGDLDGDKIRTDQRFQRTRENMSEFARSGKAVKLMRASLQNLLVHASDNRMTSRLMKRMMAVIKADTVNDRGLRNVVNGNTDLRTSNATFAESWAAAFMRRTRRPLTEQRARLRSKSHLLSRPT